MILDFEVDNILDFEVDKEAEDVLDISFIGV